MIDITEPMKASTSSGPEKRTFPLGATPKLDGIRSLMKDSLMSRNFKPIPNEFIRNKFEKVLPKGMDGELILYNGKPCGAEFGDSSSAIMSEDGEPHVIFYAFDYVSDDLKKPYMERMDEMKAALKGIKDIVILYPTIVNNEEELAAYEQKCIDEGYEGAMIRTLDGPYKCGRSTENEGYLLKIKRFKDGEAEIIGFEEKKTNKNKAEKDAFGHTKRSSKKEGIVMAGTLGNIKVRDLEMTMKNKKTGEEELVEFKIGSGFNDKIRKEIWESQDKHMGKIVKYKHQPSGAKDKPRFPVFLGFRHKDDM